MPESADFNQKLRKLRNACDHAIDILKARDQEWKIDFRFEPKGALIIVSLSGQEKKVRYRFEVTDGDGIFAKIGGGFSMKDDQLDEHIANAIEKELAKEFG
jgi:hypothetical protein